MAGARTASTSLSATAQPAKGWWWCGDAIDLPRLLPRRLRGTADLVLTSPPYGLLAVRRARGAGIPIALVAHEDVYVLRKPVI